jgi:hypothetical protein
MIDHIVDLVQPLGRITLQGVLADELLCTRAAKLARQYLLHFQENLLGI